MKIERGDIFYTRYFVYVIIEVFYDLYWGQHWFVALEISDRKNYKCDIFSAYENFFDEIEAQKLNV